MRSVCLEWESTFLNLGVWVSYWFLYLGIPWLLDAWTLDIPLALFSMINFIHYFLLVDN